MNSHEKVNLRERALSVLRLVDPVTKANEARALYALTGGDGLPNGSGVVLDAGANVVLSAMSAAEKHAMSGTVSSAGTHPASSTASPAGTHAVSPAETHAMSGTASPTGAHAMPSAVSPVGTRAVPSALSSAAWDPDWTTEEPADLPGRPERPTLVPAD
ncbi:MAG: hypothetical protein JWP52_131, partial [Rhizobacter sp.]|nr:hypothetical protein [Rhizobacter sp.]